MSTRRKKRRDEDNDMTRQGDMPNSDQRKPVPSPPPPTPSRNQGSTCPYLFMFESGILIYIIYFTKKSVNGIMLKMFMCDARHQSGILIMSLINMKTFKEPRNRFQGIDSVSLFSLAGRYVKQGCRTGPPGWESIPGLLKRFTNPGSGREYFRQFRISWNLQKNPP